MVPQWIEREIVIDAPVEVVWSVVTEPEHISRWFSDSADLDLRPGGRAVLHWNDFGTVQGRVERVEPPHFFSFRWAVDPGREGLGEDPVARFLLFANMMFDILAKYPYFGVVKFIIGLLGH